jgi:UDP-GlcNAc3NAcA epimerase
MRDETEWVELVEHGFNLLTGAEAEDIFDAYKSIAETDLEFNIELYGDGKAGERIVDIIKFHPG